MEAIFGLLAQHGDTLGIGAMLVTVVALILRQLATGALVFKRQLDELRKDKDAEIQRNIEFYDKLASMRADQAKAWELAYQNEAKARSDQAATLDEQLELARAADHMLRALPSSKDAGPTPRRTRGAE
jgi:hypothetical protein